MFRTLAKHSLQFTLLIVIALPLTLLAVWILVKFDPGSVEQLILKAWGAGTLIRVVGYFVCIDVIFDKRIEANRVNTQAELEELLAYRAEVTDEDVNDLEEAITETEARITNIESASRCKPQLWIVAIVLEVLLQLTFFTVL